MALTRLRSGWLTPGRRAVLVIVATVLAGNVLYLLGQADSSPLTWTSSVVTVYCHLSCGRPAIDPNVGFITQPLGHLASSMVLHGHWPYWNPFEGLGQPLLGEMQSAALFPLAWLLIMPAGLLWFHISLEIVAGLATYAVLRRLDLDSTWAMVGGCLFALNGTFAWLGNAVLNPVCLLPLTILGAEYIIDGVRWNRPTRWPLFAIALALGLYAGFPEVAYLDLLLVAGWVLVRLWHLENANRWRAIRTFALAGAGGLALALPVIVPFADFMKVADIGHHAHGMFSGSHLGRGDATMFLDPYFFGTIFSNMNAAPVWGGIGGYITVSVFTLALVGAFSTRQRAIRRYLVAFVVLAMLGMFNMWGLRAWWNVLPFVQSTDFARYAMPAVEFALIVLAALGLQRLAGESAALRAVRRSALLVTGALIVLTWATRYLNAGHVLITKQRIIFALLQAAPWVVLALMVGATALSRKVKPAAVLGALLVLESLAYFVVPTALSPKSYVFDEAPITYLQTHQGEYRFLDFAVLWANWGSQFRLHELSSIDLPYPADMTRYIRRHLDPDLPASNQFVPHGGVAGIVRQEHLVADHFAAYEAAGVKYLMIPANVPITSDLLRSGVRRVFSDYKAIIFEMPHPAPLFSAPGCTVHYVNDYKAHVNCPTQSTLTYRELKMKGWTATARGFGAGTATLPISTTGEVFQSVSVPAGEGIVTFNFTPPNEREALVIGLLGLLAVTAGTLVTIRRERKQR